MALSEENKKVIKALIHSDSDNIQNQRDLLYMSKNIIDESPALSKKIAMSVRQTALMKSNKDNWDELYYDSLFILSYLHDDFDAYMLRMEMNREPREKFYFPRRRQLYPIVTEMQKLIDNYLDLLTISLPPGTGKTTLEEFFVSFIMGKRPDKSNILASYSMSITRMFFDSIYHIITDDEYCWGEMFPLVQIQGQPNAKEQSINLGKWKPFKTLTCRSVGGSVTGVVRCDGGMLCCDDLVSGIEEAMSKERLDKLWQAYTVDLKQRKKGGAKELHVATRWSVYDPIGRIERQYEGSNRAEFLSLPCVDKDGKSNFLYCYGLGFDETFYKDMENSMDDVSFRCLFMNEPIEREGILYRPDELLRYMGGLPDGEPDAILSICDTKDTGTDYNFLPVMYKYGEHYYLEDVVFKNIDPGTLDDLNANMLVKHRVQQCQFESNKEGSRTANEVEKKVKQKGGRCHITKKYTTANKETKIIVNSSWVKEHVYFKDASEYEPKSDYGQMMSYLCSYTQLARNKHDDVPDGLAMFAEFVDNLIGTTVTVVKRTEIGI